MGATGSPQPERLTMGATRLSSALTSVDKRRFMSEALAVSVQALPGCRPNPPVGCVIVGANGVQARGFTGPPGEPHAEAAAMRLLAPDACASALAVFVTLEPCSFAGRTPSCAQTIIDRGIAMVFVGIIDPDPRNNGNGIRLLREAGVTVELGILEHDVRRFLGPYLIGS